MTPDKVEEIVEELFQYYDDIDCAVTVNQRITAKEQAELWLKRTLTQYHQDMVSEVVEKLEGLKITKDSREGGVDFMIRDAVNNSLTEAQEITR